MDEKSIGTVKWFNTSKGFGFISAADGSDVFVHYSDIVNDGFKNLAEGQRVSYVLKDTDKGKRAAEVKVIDDPQ